MKHCKKEFYVTNGSCIEKNRIFMTSVSTSNQWEKQDFPPSYYCRGLEKIQLAVICVEYEMKTILQLSPHFFRAAMAYNRLSHWVKFLFKLILGNLIEICQG